VDKDIEVNINGLKYNEDVMQEVVDSKVLRIDIMTEKNAKATLEELGYSFDVGV